MSRLAKQRSPTRQTGLKSDGGEETKNKIMPAKTTKKRKETTRRAVRTVLREECRPKQRKGKRIEGLGAAKAEAKVAARVCTILRELRYIASVDGGEERAS